MKLNRRLLLPLIIVLISCGEKPTTNSVSNRMPDGLLLSDTLGLEDLRLGNMIKTSGEFLIQRPVGLVRIERSAHSSDSVLVVAIHGYDSRGYEWISSLHGLTDHYGASFFYRYDWERCPQDVAKEISTQLTILADKTPSYKRAVIFSHSYGGIVTSFLASKLQLDIPAELHIIAAPLLGYPRLMNHCTGLNFDADKRIIYPGWNKSNAVVQHRTVKAQDGAFKDMEIDPQLIDLPFHEVVQLPPTMDGHRLGHNWSVSWVVDAYLGKAHRY